EYQDTTTAQVQLLRLMTRPHRRITVAGDPYQSIYSFRGAELGNVDEFGARFRPPDGRPVRRWVLGTSFRVPAGILAAAERLTAGDLPGAAGPVEPAGPGGRVDVAVFDQQTHEADWIAREIQRLHLAEGIPLQAMAVLVRSTRRLLPDLSRALDRRGIAHDRPDARLVDHPAVRAIADLVDLATADRRALPESDQRRAARRLLLGPLLALPLGGEREALRLRVRDGTPWADVLRRIEPPATEAAELIETRDWADQMAAADGFWHVWTGLGALGRTALDDPGWRAALASFAQVLGHLADREPTTTLAEMLARATADDFEAQPLLRFEADEQDRLAVTTLHQAKGLAFDVVIIADAVDGVLPDLRRTSSILHTHLLPAGRRDPAAAARFRVQEEMRLAYTAMTRARERVIWTATAAGLDETEDRPSRFLDAVAGDVDRRPADPSDSPPVTPTEAEARLRRALTDPATPAARRLAALSVLTDATLPHLRPALALAGVRVRGPNDGVVPDEAAFSPSQAMAYEACPRRYALERHLGIGDEPSVWMRFGSVVHAAAEAADRAAIAAGRDHADPDEALAALDDLFDPADFDGPPWSDHWLRRARRAVERLYAAAPPGPWAAAFVERPLRLAIDGEAWRGRADRIDRGPGGLRIVDYKTTATAVSKAEAAASLQLGFYALAAGEDPELAGAGGVSAAELWYPLARGNHVATRCFDLDELDAVRDRLRGIAEAIRAERFPPSPGGGCERCAVRVLCDAWPEGREAFVP
ncbi:MAG: ATP-dependent DNA helicase, partial [Acidimicrobiia bacterium]